MFLYNRLAKGQFEVGGAPVALTDLRTPIFCLATETDHVSPSTPVYRLHLPTDTDLTFCLTSAGHNSGVLSEPGHRNRRYRLLTKTEGERHIPAGTWIDRAEITKGSWWPAWTLWLEDHSDGTRPASKKKRRSLGQAPGSYVFG